jgi:hypothetical protein
VGRRRYHLERWKDEEEIERRDDEEERMPFPSPHS